MVDKSAEAGTLTTRRRYLETIAAETGDVDITGSRFWFRSGAAFRRRRMSRSRRTWRRRWAAAVSCSRPVVDAKWLDKSRQVGSSGRRCGPKVYLACGISGSFQHLAGHQGHPVHRGDQQESQSADFPGGGRGDRGGHPGVSAGAGGRVREEKLVGAKGGSSMIPKKT